MDTKALIAAREQLDSLAGYLLRAGMRDKVEGRQVTTFTTDGVANIAAVITKVVTIIEAALGQEAPPQPSPSFPQAPAPTPPANDVSKAIEDYNAKIQKILEDIRNDALQKIQAAMQAGAPK